MLHVHSSRPVTSLTVRIEWVLLINQIKMLSLQQVLWNIVEHDISEWSFELFGHARPYTDQRWPQIPVIVACACRCHIKTGTPIILVKSPLQIFGSVNICSYPFTSFHFSLWHFDSFHIILCHFISFHVISYHFISFLSASLYPIWWNHEKRYYLIFVRRTTSQLYHLHIIYAFQIFLVD